MNTILQRTVSGIVYIVVIIGSLFLGKITFGILLLSIGTLALFEFYKLPVRTVPLAVMITGLVAGSILIASAFLVASGVLNPLWLLCNLVFLLLLFIMALFVNHQKAPEILAIQILGILYVSLPLALATYIIFPRSFQYEYTHRIILGIFMLIWINDIFAYLTGITLGRHRLYEKMSPKKSWEGVFGGIVFTVVSAFWMGDIMNALLRKDWLIIAAIVSVFGVMGDLFESMFKREGNLKDSGNLIPGHGGILDRIDSMLFVIPAVFIYLKVFNL